jgi:membrane-associated phospholipid phosphatase
MVGGLRPRLVLVLTGAVFVVLTATALGGTVSGEAELRHALMRWASPEVVDVLRVLNFAGDWRVVLPIGIILVALLPQARARWWVWLGLIIVVPLVQSWVQYVVGRTRPEDLSLGFPSGHVTAAAAFFGVVIYLAQALPWRGPRLTVQALAAMMVVTVALARVVLRAHWPSDAVGGVALGLALASAAVLAAQVPEGNER